MIVRSVSTKLPRETRLTPWIFISICVTGLALLTLLTYSSRSIMFLWQKQVAGLLFIAICLFGMVAGVRPGLCSGTAHFKTVRKVNFGDGKNLSRNQKSGSEGHHPDCSGFDSHVLRFDGWAYCAGCMGLVTGAMMSVAGSLFYFFLGFNFEGLGTVFFWSGFAGVLLGVLQYNLHVDWASIHFLLNVFFVFGAFLLSVGVSEISRDFAVQLYFIALTVFLIFARVMLSQLEHIKICAKCSVHTCRASDEAA